MPFRSWAQYAFLKHNRPKLFKEFVKHSPRKLKLKLPRRKK